MVFGTIVIAVVLMPAAEWRPFEPTGVGFFSRGYVWKLCSEKSDDREVFVLSRLDFSAAYEYTPGLRVECFETLPFLLGGTNC